ncbi:Amidohydrolase-related [Trema orientale]|uniref:Amidohydrolase-related n=1 Tax=Trema orientale TaxID=63057 RepID=A0A2P5F246_TREOI|nr:Amidohydrolase-related [Trema orientale]
MPYTVPETSTKIIDSHLHIWASPEEAAGKYPYFPGKEPPLPGSLDLLLQCMEEAEVDGAFIVQPIYHMFDHSLVTSAIKKYPSKFVGCSLANPAEDGSGVKQLEQLVLKDGYRAVRFNPELWPSGQKMTSEIGKALFSKAGELGIPVGFLCTKVYVKFSALFRVSRKPYPYKDLGGPLSQLVSAFGANRLMWGTDFPYVVAESGYKRAKEAVTLIGKLVPLSASELDLIMGKTVMELFPSQWRP